MATDNGLLEFESGQSFQDWEAMTTSDNQHFEASFAPWSGRSGFDSEVRPWGLATGGRIIPHTTTDTITVEALTAYMPTAAGADQNGLVAVSSDELLIGRAGVDTHLITSIIVTAAGGLDTVEGTEGTSFSDTRAAAGGPPLIPVDAIEIGQVRLSSATSGTIAASEIVAVVGVTVERYDYPVMTLDPAAGEVHFATPLPAIHVGEVTKKVVVRGYVPIFAELPWCSDWVPADESHSVNSVETYSGPRGSVSRTLGQASFTHRAQDGITDPIVRVKNETLWFRWFQDRNRQPYQLTRGVLGIAREYPVGDDVIVNATISAQQPTVDMDG
jgi:hypothetical protein